MKASTLIAIALASLALLVAHLTGCTAMVHNMVVDSYPTFQQTENSWSFPSGGKGRVVIYFPRRPLQGFGAGGMVVYSVRVDGDKSMSTSIGDQTFVFVDLSPGNHLFEKEGFMFGGKTPLSVNVASGGITYVRLSNTSTFGEIVPADEAHTELAEIHHNYKKPLPFPDQPRGERRAL